MNAEIRPLKPTDCSVQGSLAPQFGTARFAIAGPFAFTVTPRSRLNAAFIECSDMRARLMPRTRISRSLSSGAHSRDPLAHPGYAPRAGIQKALRHDDDPAMD